MQVLLALIGGFAGGVFLRSLFVFGWPVVAFAMLLAAILIVVPRVRGEGKQPTFILAALFCLFVALGMGRTAVADTPLPQSFASDLRHRVTYEGITVADPDVRDANQRVEIRVSQGDETTVMLAVAPRTPTVAVGDRVRVSGTLAVPESFADDNGRVFRYDKYLQRDGVRFMLNFAYIRVEQGAPWYSVPAALARVKHSFLNGLSATLPEPYASLAGGVVIGGKSGLGAELQDAFVKSGLVQIIVLSGYNVMVVAEWVMAALALTPLPRRWRAAAGALAILLFVGVAGASATALRAMLMAFIALFARATGHTYAAGRALLVVVLLMLLYNPLYLAFDPGFGLSVAATAGLIWLAPVIEALLLAAKGRIFLRVTPSAAPPPGGAKHSQKYFFRSDFWLNAVSTTLAAQVAVLPLLLYDTGNLSLVAIPANILAMPLVPLAMGLSALAGFAGMIFGFAPAIGVALSLPAYGANAYLIWLARTAANLPFAAFTLPPFPFWLTLFAYIALVCIASSKRFSTTVQFTFAKKASI